MNILAIDLANFSSSLALIVEGHLIFSEYSDVFRGQDVTLLPKIKDILEKEGIRFEDLDRLVSTTGPGSFTGIRVALATLQGLSFAANVPTYGINSFEWVIKTYPKPLPDKTLVLLESKRLELYGQLFDKSGSALGEAFSLSPENIALDARYKGALCIGNGAHHMKAFSANVEGFMPQAHHLAAFALTLSKDDQEKYPCHPVYVRDADTGTSKNV